MKPTRMHVPLLLAAAALSLAPSLTAAHCDTLDGPVVKTALTALDAKDVRPVLAWVQPDFEEQVRTEFHAALAAREQGADREASDRRFFETVVRVHRAGEGAPFEGLKPAGGAIPEAVRAADRAVEVRDARAVEQMLVRSLRAGLQERFARFAALRPPGKDVAAGRAWVEAYVDWVHHVERVDAALRGGGEVGPAAHDPKAAEGRMGAVPEDRHAHAR